MLRETISSLRRSKKNSCMACMACMKSKNEIYVSPTLDGSNRDCKVDSMVPFVNRR